MCTYVELTAAGGRPPSPVLGRDSAVCGRTGEIEVEREGQGAWGGCRPG